MDPAPAALATRLVGISPLPTVLTKLPTSSVERLQDLPWLANLAPTADLRVTACTDVADLAIGL
jgi:hypothetical protein